MVKSPNSLLTTKVWVGVSSSGNQLNDPVSVTCTSLSVPRAGFNCWKLVEPSTRPKLGEAEPRWGEVPRGLLRHASRLLENSWPRSHEANEQTAC